MPCFGSKRVEVVDSIVEGKPERASSASKNRFTNGHSPTSRDGLSSAPTTQDKAAASGRSGLHSAPSKKGKGKKGGGNKVEPSAEPLSDFIIEASAADGNKEGGGNENMPDAEAVDAYLDAVVGSRIVKDLRASEWATRVGAIEALQQLVKRRATEDAVATGSGEQADGVGERSSLFRACVTVLARVLQDKVVPVYLPALALLAEVFSPPFLEPIKSTNLPKAAIPYFAGQLVFRAGSSNQRASSESSAALLSLARTDAVGCAAVGPHALGRLSNSKSAHAATGRLDLLKSLVSEFGVGVGVGLELREVLAFTLPLCEHASEKTRDTAMGVVLDVRAIHPVQTDRMLDELRPSAAALVKARLSTPVTSLQVSGRRLPPLAPISLDSLANRGGLPGAMPGANAVDGMASDEVVAVRGTPPDASARAKARVTAAELGARNAPGLKKKASKPKLGSPAVAAKSRSKYLPPAAAEAQDADDALAEATYVLAEEGLVQAGSPPLAPRAASLVDLTEEQMMDHILKQ